MRDDNKNRPQVSDQFKTITVQELIEKLHIRAMVVEPDLAFLLGLACGFLERYRDRISELEKKLEEYHEGC